MPNASAAAIAASALIELSEQTADEVLKQVTVTDGPILLEVKVKKGNRKDLGRPTTTPIQNKEALMEFLSK